MQIRPLIIGSDERARIAEVRAFAAANVIDPAGAETAAAADVVAFRDMMAMLSIALPVGYAVTYSHERQATLGLCVHLSISVDEPLAMPGVPAVEMILEEFGMQPIQQSINVWVEDVDDKTKAINIVQSVAS